MSLKPRPWLYLLRVPFLFLHMAIALPCTLIVINPLGQRVKWGSHNLSERMIMWWSRNLCRIFGVRIRVEGSLPEHPVMLVANHVSWIDIEVLHAIRVFSFVAKAEIAKWPVVGLLAKAGGSVFHARGSEASRHTVSEAFANKLGNGHSVAIFAEGRTSDGTRVLPFHGRMFQPAIDAGAPLLPAALRYRHRGKLVNHIVAFGPAENFVANMIRLLGLPSIEADIVLGPPLHGNGRGRKELANTARSHVVSALEAT